MEDDPGRSQSDRVDPSPNQEELQLPAAPTVEQVAEAERILQQGSLARIRNDSDAYLDAAERAARVAPGSSSVQEALGDALVFAKRVRRARDAYGLAVTLDPTNSSAERKYGETVLAVQLAMDPLFAQAVPDDSLAGGKAAVMLSFFLPGLGEIALGQTKRGAWIFGVWLVSLAIAVAVPKGLEGLLSLLGRHGAPFNPVILLPLGVCGVCWALSLSETSAFAKRIEKRPMARPVPPVNKDFEL